MPAFTCRWTWVKFICIKSWVSEFGHISISGRMVEISHESGAIQHDTTRERPATDSKKILFLFKHYINSCSWLVHVLYLCVRSVFLTGFCWYFSLNPAINLNMIVFLVYDSGLFIVIKKANRLLLFPRVFLLSLAINETCGLSCDWEMKVQTPLSLNWLSHTCQDNCWPWQILHVK